MQLIHRNHKPNMEQITSELFLVRSSAGFRRAFKTWFKERFDCGFNTKVSSTYKEAAKMLDDYPKKYPAKVKFEYQPCECSIYSKVHVEIYYNRILGWIKVLCES